MLSFNLENPGSGSIKVTEQKEDKYKSYILNYPCSSNLTCTPYITTLPTGKYKFEVIGAGGGFGDSSSPAGFGGISIGYYEVKTPVSAFFYLGGRGSDGINYVNQKISPQGGYNGGGNGGTDADHNYNYGGGGGGSSDIRISDNQYSNRIIVAGGGGGGCTSVSSAGNGGGNSGTPGIKYNSYTREGGGGTQSEGGSAFTSRGASAGQLYFGGSGSTGYNAQGGGGGGGGYFGGGGGSSTKNHGDGECASGGGGSGYIGGVLSSSLYGVTASTHTNSGNGQIKITVFQMIRKNEIICSKDRNVYSCPISTVYVIILFVSPES